MKCPLSWLWMWPNIETKPCPGAAVFEWRGFRVCSKHMARLQRLDSGEWMPKLEPPKPKAKKPTKPQNPQLRRLF
jgi:hypothetical protein